MLISPSSRSSDPVVMSRIIARTMLQEMEKSLGKSASRISVVNMLRLLEMYRYDSFRSRNALGVLEHPRVNDLSASTDAGLIRLRDALASVHHKLLPQLSAENFSMSISEALMKLMPQDQRSETTSPHGDAGHSLAKRFLKNLTKALSAQPA